MPKGFYRDLIKILKNHGCTFVRQGNGDHEIWYSPIVGKNLIVDKTGKSRHTANGVLKDAGIKSKF